MKHKQNLHVHTTYADGKDKPEELVLEAVKRGFASIGFSEHSYMDFSDYPYQMTVADSENYRKEIAALKEKYKGVIDIFCGMEYEFYSSVPTDDYDYLIGSVHYLEVDGRKLGFDRGLAETTEYIRDNFGGDGLAFSKKYFETLCRLPQKASFDILGHFDLNSKNNEKGNFFDASSKEYLFAGFEVIDALSGKIPLFEVNTGAIARGYRTAPYPQLDFMKEFKAKGFGAVISSDCHDKNYLDCFYNEAEQLLLAAGFKSYWVLSDKGFVEVGI